MTPSLTYLQFHLVFTIPPILLLGWLAARRDGAWWGREAFSGLAIIVFLAMIYTTPWTNTLIPEGVWWYGDGAVIATIWHTPLEEYLFFVLQTTLTACWLFQVIDVRDVSLVLPTSHRLAGVGAGLGICAIGWGLLGTTTSTYYLGAILVWAGPILAIQWGVGLTYLIRERWQFLLAVGVPTLYLWIADWIAISLGIWMISDAHTVGVGLAGLPLEEALFFLVTNVFIVQGLVLYAWVLERREELASRPRVDRLLSRLEEQPTDG